MMSVEHLYYLQYIHRSVYSLSPSSVSTTSVTSYARVIICTYVITCTLAMVSIVRILLLIYVCLQWM